MNSHLRFDEETPIVFLWINNSHSSKPLRCPKSNHIQACNLNQCVTTIKKEEIPVHKPEYRIRLLVTDLIPPQEGKNTSRVLKNQLKPFSDFTLACTIEDKFDFVKGKFLELKDLFEARPFMGTKAIQHGLRYDAVWAIELSLPQEYRKAFSTAFDSIMCAESNGLFLWELDLKRNDSILNTAPHITIGPNKEDEQMAHSLVGYTVVFNQMDYTRVGLNNSILSVVFI